MIDQILQALASFGVRHNELLAQSSIALLFVCLPFLAISLDKSHRRWLPITFSVAAIAAGSFIFSGWAKFSERGRWARLQAPLTPMRDFADFAQRHPRRHREVEHAAWLVLQNATNNIPEITTFIGSFPNGEFKGRAADMLTAQRLRMSQKLHGAGCHWTAMLLKGLAAEELFPNRIGFVIVRERASERSLPEFETRITNILSDLAHSYGAQLFSPPSPTPPFSNLTVVVHYATAPGPQYSVHYYGPNSRLYENLSGQSGPLALSLDARWQLYTAGSDTPALANEIKGVVPPEKPTWAGANSPRGVLDDAVSARAAAYFGSDFRTKAPRFPKTRPLKGPAISSQ